MSANVLAALHFAFVSVSPAAAAAAACDDDKPVGGGDGVAWRIGLAKCHPDCSAAAAF